MRFFRRRNPVDLHEALLAEVQETWPVGPENYPGYSAPTESISYDGASGFNVIGSGLVPPQHARDGDVWIDTLTDRTLVWSGGWKILQW
jgi:hypothetical protein